MYTLRYVDNDCFTNFSMFHNKDTAYKFIKLYNKKEAPWMKWILSDTESGKILEQRNGGYEGE